MSEIELKIHELCKSCDYLRECQSRNFEQYKEGDYFTSRKKCPIYRGLDPLVRTRAERKRQEEEDRRKAAEEEENKKHLPDSAY